MIGSQCGNCNKSNVNNGVETNNNQSTVTGDYNTIVFGDDADAGLIEGGNNNNLSFGDSADFGVINSGNNNVLNLEQGNDHAVVTGDSIGNIFNLGEGDDTIWIQGGIDTVVNGEDGNDTAMLYGNEEDWDRAVNQDGTITYTHKQDGTSVILASDVENVGFTNGSPDPSNWSFINAQTGEEIEGRPVTETFEQSLDSSRLDSVFSDSS